MRLKFHLLKYLVVIINRLRSFTVERNIIMQENTTSSVFTVAEQTKSREELRQTLKATAPKHLALNRAHAKLLSSSDTGIAISTYDRMHHRHSRS